MQEGNRLIAVKPGIRILKKTKRAGRDNCLDFISWEYLPVTMFTSMPVIATGNKGNACHLCQPSRKSWRDRAVRTDHRFLGSEESQGRDF
jgi:hypothetical protein